LAETAGDVNVSFRRQPVLNICVDPCPSKGRKLKIRVNRQGAKDAKLEKTFQPRMDTDQHG
jgi:hypothetical protein